MEPPGEGRYEDRLTCNPLARVPPQWSRPVKGGTSPTGSDGRAAMEPPGEGRYERGRGGQDVAEDAGRNGAAR